jgi:hypothetical protein
LSDGEIARLYSDNGVASPELISTAPVAGGIEIRWTATAGSGITYKVARASSLQGPFEFIGTPVSTLSFLDSSASPQQTYFYKVTAGSAGIGGPPSQVLTATAWSCSITSVADESRAGIRERSAVGSTDHNGSLLDPVQVNGGRIGAGASINPNPAIELKSPLRFPL